MWLLECEGEVLAGKKLWLKPGKKYVLGRVPSEEVNLPMPSQKSISRIHLVIEVEMVSEGDGLKLHHRPNVLVQDCGTRHGTRLDGEEMRDQTKTLSGDEHFLHLGKYEPGFRLFWKPVVISFSLSSKERKDIKKAMRPYQKKVEILDIKTIGGYAPETTHVIATKRNTAVGLQALINGKRIVTPEYLDAIVEANTPKGDDDRVKGSPLEVDFEGNWPNPESYLPPRTNEPKDREQWRFRPDKKRNSLFEGYTFIVCERIQYENFLGPITDAHGKLEMFDLEPKKTTAEELVQFVNKRERESQVVMVRFIGKQDPEWVNELSTEVQEMLGFRMVEQNEFLDIILMCDTSRLKLPLREQPTNLLADSGQVMTHSTRIPDNPPSVSTLAPTKSNMEIQETTVPQVPIPSTQVSTRGRGRARTRQTTLDPFAIDPSEFKPPPAQSLSSTTSQKTWLQVPEGRAPSPPVCTQPPSQVKVTASQSSARQTRQTRQTRPSQRASGTSIEEDDERMSVSTLESNTRLPAPQNVVIVDRKRPAAIEGPEFDIMDMLPGAREVKRRKIAEEEERIRRGETIMEEPRESIPPTDEPAEVETPEQAPLKGKSKKALSEKEDLYLARARQIKQQEEEKARRAKEEELAAMDGLEVEKMRNLAIVEVMEVKPRTDKPIRGVYGDDGDRWDDKWNGRKNFKKFRRQGRGGGMRTMRGSVMVNLVEHKGKDYGIGDGYWVDDESNKSTRKTARETAPVLVNEDSGDADRGDTQFRPALTNSARSTRRTQTQAQTQASSQTLSIAGSPSRGTKRGASAANLNKIGVVKKQKTMFLKNESESEGESEDELKFRFKKR
ncbi:hypothetical protein DFP73DRAFT_59387 [Morchella snyderi]|nr:hypothetical protein DFP73DRAFT_59387 [Morchella snyderi]